MKKILLTGSNGQLGRAIQKEYGDTASFIRTDVVEGEGLRRLDITNLAEVEEILEAEAPSSLINCAAATNVDGCEKDQIFAYKVNAIGPRNLAVACEKRGVKLVHVSTDYVFPGNDPKPLTEFDQPAPISAYGRTKYAGELFVQQFCRHWFILRTAWLYGDGKNFVRTMLKLSETHDKVSVVDDQIGSPTSAKELAKVIRHLEAGEEYGLYHATCEGSTNWAAFTEEIFRLAGRSTQVEHVSSAEYKRRNPASADRPAYSCLDNLMLRLNGQPPMADWKDAIADYMKEEGF